MLFTETDLWKGPLYGFSEIKILPMYEMATSIPILEYLSQSIKTETSDSIDRILSKILKYLTKTDGEIDHWLNPFFFATKYDLLDTMKALIWF